MPYPWTADDLLFALIRAGHLEPPQIVAESLLAAADRPDEGLAGVTPLRARLRAAQVLIEAGRAVDAIAVARDAEGAAGPDADGIARMEVACILAEAGAVEEAAALALAVLREHPGREYRYTGYLLSLSSWLAANGHLSQATRLADEAAVSVASLPGSDGKFHYSASIRAMDKRAGQLKSRIMSITEGNREKIRDKERRAAGEGADSVQDAVRRRHEAGRDAAAEIAGQRSWPALVDDRLLWWPRGEYDRLMRQLPDLAGVLGETWRDHTTRVESFLSGAPGPAGGTALLLAHADFPKFAAYLTRSGADPRLSTVQTAFTRHAGAGYRYPARWPPGRRYPCWCDSHRKYQNCCGAAAATTSTRRR
jgi:hypothetical protein